MEIAKILVNGIRAHVVDEQTIPAGIIGATVSFTYLDPMWDNLTKNVVFRGCCTRDILNAGPVVTIPAEVVARSGSRLSVGVYGVDTDNNVAIPTLWANLGTAMEAADPSGDQSADPEIPVWAQVQRDLPRLASAAANEVLKQAKESGEFDGKDGAPGEKGEPGETGEPGPQGPIGPQGDPGVVPITSAKPGQLILVKSVDDTGKPAEWEAVDRTHWAEGSKVEIWPETKLTLALDDGEGVPTTETLGPRDLVVGETYTVNWNGVEYACVAQDVSGVIGGGAGIGNLSSWGLNGAGEPFMLLSIDEGDGIIVYLVAALDGTTEVTISLYQGAETVHKLDNKYLDLLWLPTRSSAPIIPELSVNATLQVAGTRFMAYLDYVTFENGQKVAVKYDGETYQTTVSVNAYGNAFIGNIAMFPDGAGVDTGEPFLMVFIPADNSDDAMGAIYCTVSGTHTVSVAGYIPNKMPEEYLPDSVKQKTLVITDARFFDPNAEESYTANMTFEEAWAAFTAGELTGCKLLLFINQNPFYVFAQTIGTVEEASTGTKCLTTNAEFFNSFYTMAWDATAGISVNILNLDNVNTTVT